MAMGVLKLYFLYWLLWPHFLPSVLPAFGCARSPQSSHSSFSSLLRLPFFRLWSPHIILQNVSINPSWMVPLSSMIPTVAYQLVTPAPPPAPYFVVQRLVDRPSWLSIVSQTHCVQNWICHFPSSFFRSSIIHLTSKNNPGIYNRCFVPTSKSDHPVSRGWRSTVLYYLERRENWILMITADSNFFFPCG